MIKVLGIILIFVSLSELAIFGSSENYEIEEDLHYAIENDIKKFHNILLVVVITDAIFGLICAMALLWFV